VDDTVELDRYLGSGARPRTPPSLTHIRSPPSSGPPFPPPARPRLADQLHRGAFSPKRPRGAQASPAVQLREHQSPAARIAARIPAHNVSDGEDDAPTPRPRRRHAPARSQPDIRVHSATPTESTFTQKARALGADIAAAQRDAANVKSSKSRQHARAATDNVPPTKTAKNGPAERGSLRDLNAQRNVAFASSGNNSRSKIHLPDITGLTSAVATPAKGNREYRKYRDAEGMREVEGLRCFMLFQIVVAHITLLTLARLITVLNSVQSKLATLEEENGVSRRRVRELELELEACRQDVVRERTRVLERESRAARERAGLSRLEAEENERRFKVVIEEKKG
jgi:hypothetical protein